MERREPSWKWQSRHLTLLEWQLSRQLYATLQSDDVVVADSAYGTYGDLALVRATGADAV